VWMIEARNEANPVPIGTFPAPPFDALGTIDPDELTGQGLDSARAGRATLSFLGETLHRERPQAAADVDDRPLSRRSPLHDKSIQTHTLRFDAPFTWAAFSAALERPATLRDPVMLGRLIEQYGADHVVLGTDYPYDMADDDPMGTLAQVNRLPKVARELVAGGNAARLLKLKP
ncbi:MAG: amidohydrolase family protein, partial [Rubrivivax sp.]|nr:amidohydrolase family protein [Rubrivivax sp.]